MESFREQISKNSGTSIRGKRPTKERLLKNVERISIAIDTIQNDIKMKSIRGLLKGSGVSTELFMQYKKEEKELEK